MPDKRAARNRKDTVEIPIYSKDFETENITVEQPGFIKTQTSRQESIESLDAQIDLIIKAFNALKRLTVLEKELNTLKQENEAAKLEIERLKAQENKRLEQEKRWMLINTEDMPGS